MPCRRTLWHDSKGLFIIYSDFTGIAADRGNPDLRGMLSCRGLVLEVQGSAPNLIDSLALS
ncbi:MAG: hypothetical protein ACI855_000502, partial [Myxococcota bacterium]